MTLSSLESRQLIHLGNNDDSWCYGVKFADRQLYESDCIDILTYRTPTPLKLTKATRLRGKDENLLEADLSNKKPPPKGVKGITCSYVFSPSLVLKLLREKGVCAAAAKSRNGDKKQAIQDIWDMVDSVYNFDLMQTQPFHYIRMDALQKARIVALVQSNLRPDFDLPDSPMKGPVRDLELYQVQGHILKDLLVPVRDRVATAIDNSAVSTFGIQLGLTKIWADMIAEIRLKHVALQETLQREINCLPNERAGGSGGPSGSGGGGRPLRFARRFNSMLVSSDQSSLRLTSLQRRARTAAKTGPKAAKAPSCQCKKNPPKKVPRSQVKTKPKPAIKPRKPSTRPNPKPAQSNKKVVPRPATRPRRVPGKETKPTRVTPKKQPRVVPKPTRRPKGTPRTRRGRRK